VKLHAKTLMRNADEVREAGIPIVVSINEHTVRYRAYVTDAPGDYDGFGTLAVIENEEFRIVLIREENLDWQWGRYSSGLHIIEKIADSFASHFTATDISKELWERLGKTCS
jgi:hypothetical protein